MSMMKNEYVGDEELSVSEVYVRVPFRYDTVMVMEETSLHCEDESLAVQSDAEDADINTLVKRFHITGEMPQRVTPPLEADFVGTTSYQEALNLIRHAEESFMELPAEVRAKLNHDPGELVAIFSNPNRIQEARDLGLMPLADKPVEASQTPPSPPGPVPPAP